MKWFTISELCNSAQAKAHGIINTPGPTEVENMKALIEKVLDPLREMYGKPVVVNSGYRCGQLNKLVGGKPTSQHQRGQAADIRGRSKADNKMLFELIRDNLEFDQLIDEAGLTWVHVSYRNDGKNRKQVLKL